jgi:hypothetical protein
MLSGQTADGNAWNKTWLSLFSHDAISVLLCYPLPEQEWHPELTRSGTGI